MTDDTAAREAIMQAVDAYDAARLAHHGQSPDIGGMSETNKRSIAPMIQAAIDAYLSASRSIPAAAALLRAAGFVVIEPGSIQNDERRMEMLPCEMWCERCKGTGDWEMPGDMHKSSGIITCPTCNGTGARPADQNPP